MDGWLKGLVATASLVVIAGGAYFFWREYQAHERAIIARADKRFSLTTERCNSMAAATIPEKPGMEPRTGLYLEDLKICDDLKRLDAYERHQLDLIGVF